MGVLVVSDDSHRYLNHAFPGLPNERASVSMNFETFSFVPWEQKRSQIAFLMRKNTSDLAQVLKILSLRGRLYWSWS